MQKNYILPHILDRLCLLLYVRLMYDITEEALHWTLL